MIEKSLNMWEILLTADPEMHGTQGKGFRR